MMRRQIMAAAALALMAGGPAVAQEMRGPQWQDNRWQDNRGAWDRGFERSGRESFERGYEAGRRDERMLRDRDVRDQAMRDREMNRAAFTDARDELATARREIERGDLRDAWVALGRAETRLVTRVLGQESEQRAATGGAVGAIREARSALRARDTDRALALTARAQELVREGFFIGENVSGGMLSGAGEPGAGQRFYSDRRYNDRTGRN
jgi:hypothetical protein